MGRHALLTPDAILERVHAYVEQYGHLPSSTQLASVGLSLGMAQQAFGGMRGLRQAYRERYTPQDSPKAGWVTCLKCGERWYSPDRYLRHNHEACNREEREDGAWMTGEIAREDWWALFDEEDTL